MKIDVMKLEYSHSYRVNVVSARIVELDDSLFNSPDLLSAEMVKLTGSENCRLMFKPGWDRPTLIEPMRREERRDTYDRSER